MCLKRKDFNILVVVYDELNWNFLDNKKVNPVTKKKCIALYQRRTFCHQNVATSIVKSDDLVIQPFPKVNNNPILHVG